MKVNRNAIQLGTGLLQRDGGGAGYGKSSSVVSAGQKQAIPTPNTIWGSACSGTGSGQGFSKGRQMVSSRGRSRRNNLPIQHGCLNGLGVPADPAESLRYFSLAAAQGDTRSQFQLGVAIAGRGMHRIS